MCGLVGIAGPGINYWDLDILREMTYLSGLRGMDSTGVFQGRSKTYEKDESRLLIEKNTFDPAFFMKYHKFHAGGNKGVFDGVTNNFFCVHTRAATIGRITNENAHPFEFSRFVGCHNGTLNDLKYRHKDKTDSEMFIKDINAHGVKEVLEELNPGSAYAIVLYDKETGELIFARNEQRTLWVGFNKRRGVMYYASEQWMIKEVLKRNKEELLDDEIRFFEPNVIHTVHPGTDIKTGNAAVFTKEKVAPKTYGGYGMWEGWEGEGYSRGPNTSSIQTWRERQESKKKEEQNTSEKSPDKQDVKPESSDDKKDLIETKELLKSTVVKELRHQQQQSRLIPSHLSLVPRSRVTTTRTNFNNQNKIPLYHCCACQQKMSLVEQYFATKLGEKTFIHKACQNWEAVVDQMMNDNIKA